MKSRFAYPSLSTFILVMVLVFSCSKNSGGTGNNNNGGGGNNPPVTPPVTGPTDVDAWMTRPDQSSLLKKQTAILKFGTTANQNTTIEVDTTVKYQTVDGFGYCLTGGSASLLINQLNQANRTVLLKELFGNGDDGIGISYLRVSIGASDLNSYVYSYDDLGNGETDMNLDHFSLAQDLADVVPVLKEILAINPNIKILGSPWSAPLWMKDNNSSIGGSLQPKYYEVYAKYFVKYIQAMKAEGITIDAITPQNEPLNPFNNPSMSMTAIEQANFVKSALGPAFKAAGINTKIIAWDHNCDNTAYPLTVLNDKDAYPYVDGSAFHLYNGDISALNTLHVAHPNKNVYFTEQWTAATGDFGGDLKWHLKNVIIGSMRNWSKNALEWNLANDPNFNPHTINGCGACKGALTIGSNQNITRNVSYYIVAHASKFVPMGSVRVASETQGNLNNVAFQRPDDKKVLIVENDGSDSKTFNIKFNGKWVTTSLNGGEVETFVF